MRRMLGFTLLELLVAIALVSIVFVLAVSSWKEIEEQQAEAEVACVLTTGKTALRYGVTRLLVHDFTG